MYILNNEAIFGVPKAFGRIRSQTVKASQDIVSHSLNMIINFLSFKVPRNIVPVARPSIIGIKNQ